MPKTQRIVVVAGEESGDAHAAAFIKQLKQKYPALLVSGIGGQHMQEAGAELVVNLARYGVTGFTEVIRYFKILRSAFMKIKRHLIEQKPDLLILVDYPGFNLRLARFAKKQLGLKIIYYISPQIWAWKAKRIEVIKQCVDKMAVILPFEKAIYQKAGVPVSFVGHPLMTKLPFNLDSLTARKELGLPLEKPIIALLPGSRTNEIERHMPILSETVLLLNKMHPEFHYALPIAGTISSAKIKTYFASTAIPVTFIEKKAVETLIAADFAVVASGTASLECALLNRPMCIIYKASWLTYFAAMTFIKVKFLGLCNLLMNKMVVPEFLQYDCNAHELTQYIARFYKNPQQPQHTKNQLMQLRESLSSEKADESFFNLIEKELTKISPSAPQ